MTKINNNSNSIQGDLTTSLAISGYCLPISKFINSNMSSESQILSTTSSEILGMNITLPEQGVYEIGANVVEDVSSITANTSANYSLYQLYSLPVWIPRIYGNWYGVASSSDGLKLAICAASDYVYTSSNSGISWVQQIGSGVRNWQRIVCSSDGSKVIAGSDYIYTNTNYGSGSWTQQTNSGSRAWWSMSCSSDASKIFAGVYSGYIYTNTNYGSGAWYEVINAGSRIWSGLACSSDGKNIAACVDAGYIYTNTNYGSGAWYQTSAPISNWYRITCSSDFSKIAASAINGYVYTNTNYGSGTWVQQTGSGSRAWSDICGSTDGKNLIACANNDYIYTNTNYGSGTWTQQTNSGSRSWYSIACSSDGLSIVAGEYPGYVYTTSISNYFVENSQKIGIKISSIISKINGISGKNNNFNWIYNNQAQNNNIKLYCNKVYNTTGDWIVRSDSSGRSSMYARLIL